ncbi:MarR family winged helix-turn-helix transcriptional regulator [Ottowia thiooxydans]|uniref:MarR family winged helix-turn-helix transcriptional regulator n=1 Tax=Ottowia thiooxydans TaxID=219182 RepID=UPI000406B8E5|nr:MarR family winged helix-turn-helix transcriptional regulator [Ottowia thiooxydans]
MPRPRTPRKTPSPSPPRGATKEVQSLLDSFRLEDVPSHLLRRAHFKAEEIFANTFSDEGVTPRQKATLVLLHQEPGLNQNALSARLAMDRNTVADMVRRMCSSELIERRASPADARAYELYVAPRGIELLNLIMPRDASVEDRLLTCLPQEYRGLFVKCLRLIAEDAPQMSAERTLPE